MNKALNALQKEIQCTLDRLGVVYRDCNGDVQGDCTMCPGGGVTTNVLGWNPLTDTLTSVVNGVSDSVVITLDSAGNLFTYPAGQNLVTGRVVIIEAGKAWYFQPSNIAHHNRAAGITKSSASTGADVTIQPYGVISDAAFTFAPDIPLWVNTNGEVVNTINPSWLITQKAGVSYENDKMLIDFSTSVKS